VSDDQPIELIVYGDFNCPFSALASSRVRDLERRGIAHVDWRAVEHAPDIPPSGNKVTGELLDELQSEIEQIRGLLTSGESDRLTRPTVQANTKLATAAYAGTAIAERPALRARLFDAYWCEDADLDRFALAQLGAKESDASTAAKWQGEWLGLAKPIVPTVVFPDGYVSRGLGALSRLARLAEEAAPPRPAADHDDQGGEAPCYAHLLDDRY